MERGSRVKLQVWTHSLWVQVHDLFAPTAGHSTTTSAEYVALKPRLVIFTQAVTKAFFHVDVTQEVYVQQPPKLCFDEHSGADRVCWRRQKQQYR